MFFCIKSYIGTQGEVGWPPAVYSTDRSKTVVPVLVLPFVALWFILRDDLFYVMPCFFFFFFLVLVVFNPFSIVITSFGEERASLVLFVRLFDLRLFGFVSFLFPFVSGGAGWLRFVIVRFYIHKICCIFFRL